MVDIKRKKPGFSLAEALVSMLVLSIFFVASSRIITTKPKKEVQMNRHGYFECFKDHSGVMKQKRCDGSYAGDLIRVEDGVCRFTPPRGIAFVVIYALNNGAFYTWTEPQFNSDRGNDDEITIDESDLANFQANMEFQEEDPSGGNSNMAPLKNFFQSSYPSSSIYEELDKFSTYQGPAVFIGW